jgi:nicotinamidase-related amidase
MLKPVRPIGDTAVLLFVDMQRIFALGAPWQTPWMPKVLPVIEGLTAQFSERTILTRFITPERPSDMPGAWRHYYEKWKQTTREVMDLSLLRLLPELERFAPPAHVFDKSRFSAFWSGELHQFLQSKNVDTLIIGGAETDVCVLATVLSAVDLGYRVIVLEDAICSSSDEGHDALLQMYRQRFSVQIETNTSDWVLKEWKI